MVRYPIDDISLPCFEPATYEVVIYLEVAVKRGESWGTEGQRCGGAGEKGGGRGIALCTAAFLLPCFLQFHAGVVGKRNRR